MIIRKTFKYEMAHIVRNARSQRCSRNNHGHSYELEVLLSGANPDMGQMLIDFGLIKKWYGDFVDIFDHASLLWNIPRDKEIIEFFGKNFERVIVTPFSSTAEEQAKMFAQVLQAILYYETLKGEFKEFIPEGVEVHSCKVHETKTGYGEYVCEDYDLFPDTMYPIKIFTQEEMNKVISEPDFIWISQQCYDELSEYGKKSIEHYNEAIDIMRML